MQNKRFYIIFIAVLILGLGYGFFKILNNKEEPKVDVQNQVEENKTTQTILIFFPNNKFDPDMMDCSRVYEVEREVPKTVAIGTAALKELLKGPTEQEKAEGYFTSLNEGIELNSLVIKTGTATADFNEQLDYQVGGSCRVASIRSQITETLKQFNTVQKVIIAIKGETELILQP